MKRRKHGRAAWHIAASGTALAKRFRNDAELAAASTRVVAHRTTMLAEALTSADPRAGVEVARMGAEKISAATQGGAAALVESFSAGRLWFGLWFRQTARTMALASALSGTRTQSGALSVATRTMEAMSADLLTTGMALTRLVQNVTDAAIQPIHRTAVANARRLTG
ncbi:MAG: hypothetical protein NTY59_16720 [Alphaproteobacteria bacterium]|nr:hypothetical protein [Alphaproteobacteria bacterium]